MISTPDDNYICIHHLDFFLMYRNVRSVCSLGQLKITCKDSDQNQFQGVYLRLDVEDEDGLTSILEAMKSAVIPMSCR